MTQQQMNNTAQKQKLKKYLVFVVMFLAFGGCIWLIFAPSQKDKESQEQSAGFNADIPDPKDAGMIDDKKTAYEQEQLRQKQEEKMRSLQDYSFMLDSPDKNQDDHQGQVTINPIHTEPEKSYTGQSYGSGSYTGYSNRKGNSFESSNAAYMDINRTLGSFYEDPKEDSEVELLREELELLKIAMAEQQEVSTSVDDQLALLEKSYELAAKYMPGNQGETGTTQKSDVENSASGKKTEVVPVSQVKKQVVSLLQQPMSDLEFVRQFSQPRNMEFNTVGAEEVSGEKNTINAVVHDDQTLINGQSVKLRMTEAMRAGRYIIPKNTILTGTSKISGERLEILISSIEYEGNIIPVSLQAYDSDGQHGIYIPGSMEMNAIKEIAGNMGQNMGSSITITQQGQSAGEQLLTDLGRGAIQGTSQYISKKAREIKVMLKAGYRIFLLPSDNK
ncbi:conjugative transposon protein TraM [Bacteroides sp. 51]|uniref:conjugative transposon protein TraM n=1 Tax=Bacteroides sp. 51 TaxID=2302938 RepID=UPI0013D7DA1E|nr:conjugative transposon protein TraM [Bacteroides sp. 51]NDV84523.1 conjugative transposon protein TraM [Bacteroides sp. 51]